MKDKGCMIIVTAEMYPKETFKVYLRKVRGVKRSLDDASVDSENGENDAGEEHKGQLVDIFHADKDD